jgi:hypothetical protein
MLIWTVQYSSSSTSWDYLITVNRFRAKISLATPLFLPGLDEKSSLLPIVLAKLRERKKLQEEKVGTKIGRLSYIDE